MNLSQSDYEMEMQKPPSSKVNQTARAGVAYQKRSDAMNPEEQKRALGYIHFTDEEYALAREERTRVLASSDNWVTRLFAERAKNTLTSR